MPNTKVMLNALSAINLTNLSESGSGATPVNLAAGQYAVTLSEDTMQFKANTYIQQVILFNPTPHKDGSCEKWYYTISTSEGTTIEVDGTRPVYVFIVDHYNVRDNSGNATVTFTPV